MVSSILPKKDIQHFNPLDFSLLNFLPMWPISIQTKVSISLVPSKKYPHIKMVLLLNATHMRHTHIHTHTNLKMQYKLYMPSFKMSQKQAQ